MWQNVMSLNFVVRAKYVKDTKNLVHAVRYCQILQGKNMVGGYCLQEGTY